MKDKHGRHLEAGDAVMAEKDGAVLFTVVEGIYLDERGCRACGPQVERAAVRAVQDMDACGCVLTKLGLGVEDPELEVGHAD